MAPTSALIQINSKCVLCIRVFINRSKILRSITNSDTIFEAPILSNNSIIRLKTPATRLHLSHKDMRSLSSEIRDSLLFILYELCSPTLEQHVLNKLKVDTFMDFADVLEILLKESTLGSKSTDMYNLIDGIDVRITSIQRTGKKSYKLHFSHNWKLDIIIEDIDKLAHWRKLLVLLDSVQMIPDKPENIPLFIPFKSTNVLIRTFKPALSANTTSDPQESDAPPILVEPNDGDMNMPSDSDVEMITEQAQDTSEEKKPKKKPLFDYQYRGMRLFDKGISIHVLERPKRGKKHL